MVELKEIAESFKTDYGKFAEITVYPAGTIEAGNRVNKFDVLEMKDKQTGICFLLTSVATVRVEPSGAADNLKNLNKLRPNPGGIAKKLEEWEEKTGLKLEGANKS